MKASKTFLNDFKYEIKSLINTARVILQSPDSPSYQRDCAYRSGTARALLWLGRQIQNLPEQSRQDLETLTLLNDELEQGQFSTNTFYLFNGDATTDQERMLTFSVISSQNDLFIELKDNPEVAVGIDFWKGQLRAMIYDPSEPDGPIVTHTWAEDVEEADALLNPEEE